MISSTTQIPKKLLELRQNQLEIELNKKSSLNSRWIERCDHIYEVLLREGNAFVLKDDDGCIRVDRRDNIKNSYNPLTTKDVLKVKKNIIRKSFSDVKIDRVIKYVEKTAIELYGEDKIDIQKTNSDMFDLIVWFPSITVTNSIEISHEMRDVYLRLSFCYYDGFFFLKTINLARTSFSVNEIYNSYLFSHVSSSGPLDYSSAFCFGDSQFSNFMKRMHRSENNMVGSLVELLMNIEQYLKWESIEGVPYVYMESIYNKIAGFERARCPIAFTSNLLDEYESIVMKSISEFDFEYDLSDSGSNFIKPSQSLVNKIEDILDSICDDSLKFIKLNGQSVISNEDKLNDILSYNGKETRVRFKGEFKLLEVYDAETYLSSIQEIINKKSIHLGIVNGVASSICRKLEYFIINKRLNG